VGLSSVREPLLLVLAEQVVFPPTAALVHDDLGWAV
jgi:hypothetical protein